MEKIIESSTVKSILDNIGVVKAEGPIRHYSLKDEFKLVGFLPYNANLSLARYINMNGKLSITPYLARYDENNYIISIMKYVRIEKEKKFYLSTNNIIPVNDVIKELSKNNFGAEKKKLDTYTDNPNKDTASRLLKVLEPANIDFLIMDEEGKLFYNPDNNPLFFYRDIDNKTCVADAFLCLCSYINPKTGNINYVGLPPEECICTIEDVQGEIKEHPIKDEYYNTVNVDELF